MADNLFHAVLGRALTDSHFRDRLLDRARQEKALKEMGVEPTDKVITELNNSIAALNRLSSSLDRKSVVRERVYVLV